VGGGIFNIGSHSDTVGTVTLTSGSITGSTGVLSGSSYAVESGLISAILGGSAALTKSTAGTVVLSAANTYTGNTNISQGTLRIGPGGSLGGGSYAGSITIATGATLHFSGTSNQTYNSDFSGSGAGNVLLSNDTPASAVTLTLGGTSTGAWSGTTTINPAMTLALSGSSQALLNTSGITLNGGNLTLTNTSLAEAGLDRVSTAGITSNGGTFTWTNTAASGRVYAETTGSVGLVSGQTNFALTTNQSSGGGNKQTLTLGTSGSGLTRTGATNTSVVSFGSATGLNTTTNIIQVFGASGSGTSGSTASVPVIGPWAFYGTTPASPTDYAVYDASGRVLNASISATAENSGSWISGANVTLNAPTTLTATRTVNTLRYSGGAGTLFLGASNNLETYGLLNGGSGLTISTSGTGALTTPTGGGYLYLTPGAAAITVSAPINDNGGAVTLVKSGSNTLTLSSNTSNFSGGVVVNAGTLTLGTNSDANLGAASGGLTFNGTATLGYTDGLTLNANRTVTINAGANVLFSNAIRVDGILTGSGAFRANTADGFVFSNPNNDFSGTITSETAGQTGYGVDMASIGDGAGAGLINLNNGSFRWIRTVGGPTTFSNRQFALSGTTGAGVISSMGSQTLTINKDLLVTGVGNKTLTLAGTNNGINVFKGSITNGTNGGTSVIGLTKAEAGTWALSGTNTYSGDTNLAAAFGLLIFQGSQSLSPSTTLKFAQVSSSVQSARFLDDGAGTINFNRPIEHGGSNTSQVLNLFVGNNNTANGGSSSGTTTGSTIQVGNITHTSLAGDTGTWTLNATGANGYRLQTGTLTLNNLTARTAAQTTTYVLNPTSANMTVAAVTMATGNITADDGIPVLRLAGTSSDNIVTGAISNASDFATGHALSLEKQSSSTWTLQGTNTYTGTTTVTGGELLIGSTGSLHASSAVTVSGGAIGGTGTVNGAVSLTTAGGIDLRDNAVGALTLGSTLANSGAAGANNLYFDLGNGTDTTDKLVVNGATNFSATSGSVVIHLSQLGGLAGTGPAPGSSPYTLIQGGGILTNGSSAVLNTTRAFRQLYTLGVSGNDIQLTTAAGTAGDVVNNHYWKGDTSVWNTAQWYSDSGATVTATAPGYNSNVVFAATSPGSLTNSLGADFEINSLTFTDATGNVTIGGTNMLTIDATNANGNTLGNGIDSQKTSGTNTISAKVGLGSSQKWTVAAGGTLAVSGAITDFNLGYGLTKAGGGTLTLTGTNTYSGPLVMAGGTLSLGGSPVNSIGTPSSVTFTGNSTIAHTGTGELTLAAVQIDPGVTAVLDKGSAGGGGTFTFDGALTGSGTLSFASGASGGGTFNLNNAGAFTGTVQTSSYTTNGATNLSFASLGDAATITHGGTAIGLTVNYTGSADLTFTTRQFVMASSQGIAINNNGLGSLVINQALSVTAAGAKTLTLGGTNNVEANTFAGLIANGSGTIGLTKAGTGTWTVSNTANSYTGITTISGGILSVSKLDNAGSNSSIGAYASSGAAGLVLSGGTLRYTGGTVATNRGFTQSAGSGINIAGTSAADLTFGDSAVSGNGTLLTLTGTPGSSLTISGAVNNTTTASNGWNIDPSINLTISGVMSGTGGISRRSGAGSITLNNDNNSFTGLVSTNAAAGSGALFFTSIADYGVNSALGRGTSGVAIALGGNVGPGAPLTYIGDGDSSNRQFALGNNASIVNNGTGALTFTGFATDSNKFIQANQTSGARTLTLGGAYTGSANLISGNIDDNDTNGATSGIATVAIAKDGPGTWAFSGTNTYTGGTIINGGTLQFAKLVSQPASGAVAVRDTATLAVNLGGTGEWDTGASGNGTIGGLLAGLGGQTGGTVTYTGNVTLGFDTSNAGSAQTYSSVISNVGTTLGITKLGTGTLELTNTNTYTGTTRIDAGTLVLGHATNTLADTSSINVNGGTLSLGANSDTVGAVTLTSGSITGTSGVLTASSFNMQSGEVSAILGGTGDLRKTTSGTFTITSAVTYTGGTFVEEGTILLDSTGSTSASSAVSVAAFGTIGGLGTIGGTLEVSGKVAPGTTGDSKIGTLTAGTTTWNGGAGWKFDLASTGNSSDKLVINGDFTKGTGDVFEFDFTGSTPEWSKEFVLATWTGMSDFVADDFSYTGLFGGSYVTSFFTITEAEGLSSLKFTAIPEPTSALAGLLIGAGLLRRRRRSA
jgi:autotransporter-associated beta strand protein